MKKILFVFILALAASPAIQAQCRCNPDNFCPFSFTYMGATTDSRTVTHFTVKCNEPVKLNSCYKCAYSTEICERQLSAVLTNGSGTIIRTYASFDFPFDYTFATAGNYVLTVTPICAGVRCTPAVFNFTVICDGTSTSCACDPKNRWDKFTAYIDKKPQTVNCGRSFKLTKKQPFGLEGGYKCTGDCKTTFTAVLTNTGTSTVVMNYPDFTFNWLYQFNVAGNYKLVISPTCNGKKCTECVYYFVVN